MNRFRSFLGLWFLSLAGCFPVERFWWSPDGEQAIVVAGEKPQLHLVKAGGELGSPVAKMEIDDDLPLGVEWVPDGSGFVFHRVQAKAKWEEVRRMLTTEEVDEIERLALGVPDLLQAAAAMAGNAEEVGTLLHAVSGRDQALMSAAFFQAREKQKAAVDAALLAHPKGPEIIAAVNAEATPFRVHEICLVKVKGSQPNDEPLSLARSIHPVLLPRISPKFPVVAYWKVVDDEKDASLEVASLDGKSRMFVADNSAPTFDWTIDGRSLIMATGISDGDSLVQTIRRVTVLQESGGFQEENREAIDLAVAIMPTSPRLCVLPDDRVLFASQPARLPALSSGLDLEPRLFVVAGDGKSINEVPTAPGDLPTNLSFFAASPDGKRVAVVESDTVVVAVVELATGKTEIISPARAGWSCRTMPAWKSATELTFAAFAGTAGAPKWMLWKQGEGVRSISESWAAGATQQWLSEKKDPPRTTNKTP